MTGRVASPAAARAQCETWRAAGQRIVFTNGVFDLLHRGHADVLAAARGLGDRLVVGVNHDASVRRLKGGERPIVPFEDRSALVAALRAVDLVVGFDGDTPEELIRALRPDVLVKGADYAKRDIVGAAFVESYGGRVATVELTPGRSTSALVRRIVEAAPGGGGAPAQPDRGGE